MTQLLRNVSKLPIAFGGAAISGEGGGYGFGDISESDAISLLREALEGGINIFDTAPIYGFGMSEQRIGKAFKQNREKTFIISKSGITWHPNKRVDMTNDPAVTLKMLEQSLRDLDSDYIDLYMVHWPDANVDIRKPLEIIAKAKVDGKVKHIGLCNTNIEDLEKAREIDSIEVVQSQFNVFDRTAVEDLFPYLTKNDISFMSWGTLDKGILSKRVDRSREQSKGYDQSDCRKNAPWWNQKEILAKVEKLEGVWELLDEHNHTGLEMALGHNLLHPECTIALVGAKNQKQLASLLKAVDNMPSKNLMNRIEKIVQA